MTQVTVTNTQPAPKLVKITEAETGKWYKVYSYSHHPNFNENIGILVLLDLSYKDQPIKSLICTSGKILNHEDFVLQELTSVEISYK